MRPYRPGIDPERRKGPDIWTKSLRWFTVFGWLIMLLALIFVGFAKPQQMTFFGRFSHVKPGGTVNFLLVQIIFYLMILGLFLSVLGSFINLKRLRRRDDEYRVSLILLGLISLLGIFVYLFFI
ncbi:MAG TPA: hypothetical protein ENK14_00290 [Caldithrix sp.]|nr:hypothetical protein [Caldithrix sp.]